MRGTLSTPGRLLTRGMLSTSGMLSSCAKFQPPLNSLFKTQAYSGHEA